MKVSLVENRNGLIVVCQAAASKPSFRLSETLGSRPKLPARLPVPTGDSVRRRSKALRTRLLHHLRQNTAWLHRPQVTPVTILESEGRRVGSALDQRDDAAFRLPHRTSGNEHGSSNRSRLAADDCRSLRIEYDICELCPQQLVSGAIDGRRLAGVQCGQTAATLSAQNLVPPWFEGGT